MKQFAACGNYKFIDLAQCGKNNWLKIGLVLLLLFAISLPSVAISALARFFWFNRFGGHLSDKLFEITLAWLTAPSYFLGLFIASRFIIDRPFITFITAHRKFRLHRVLWGGLLWLILQALILAIIISIHTFRHHSWPALPHFRWPDNQWQGIIALLLLPLIPFQAASEELIFRGWLTQSLRKYIRNPIILIFTVALLFAGAHEWIDWSAFAAFLEMALIMSTLSLIDNGIELAIGAHAMANILFILTRQFFSDSGHASLLRSDPTAKFAWIPVVITFATFLTLVLVWRKRERK